MKLRYPSVGRSMAQLGKGSRREKKEKKRGNATGRARGRRYHRQTIAPRKKKSSENVSPGKVSLNPNPEPQNNLKDHRGTVLGGRGRGG